MAQRAFLQDAAVAFAPIPTARHGIQVSRVPVELRSAGHVFIRHDAHRGPPAAPLRWAFPGLGTQGQALGGRPGWQGRARLGGPG